MTPTETLRKDLIKRLKQIKKGDSYLADQIGENRVTVYFFLRVKRNNRMRTIHYDLGVKMQRWLDFNTAVN